MKLTYEQKQHLSAFHESIKNQTLEEGRSYTPAEENLLVTLLDAVEERPASSRSKVYSQIPDGPIGKNGLLGTGESTNRNLGPGEPRGPNDDKSYRSLFGKNTGAPKWKDESVGFFGAVHSGRHHPDLQARAMTEGLPSGGGYLVPSEYAQEIHSVALESEIVQPRANVVPMTSNEKHLPGLKIGDHSSILFGGFIAYYKDEESSLTEADPKTRDVLLRAQKLTGLIKYSSELAEDTPNFEEQIRAACGKGLGWYRDKAFLKGLGAGEPLGVKNADCLIEVAKTGAQTADTLTYLNLANMFARLWSGSFKSAVWVAHPTTIPQLLQLEVGTGNTHYPVLTESNGNWQMLTRPCIFTEKMEVLGDKFDILLADFSQYLVGMRSGMRYDVSPHVAFQTDMLYGRLIERHDGMCLWSEALTLEDGSTTVSPFITLAERGA